MNLKTLFVYWIRAPSLATLVTNSVTDSLTPSCLVNLIEVTLACEDANSKLVELVSNKISKVMSFSCNCC